MSGLEPPRLHAVAAQLHVAPAARVIFAGIEEQPAAGRAPAGVHVRDSGGGEQCGGRFGHCPYRQHGSGFETSPVPRGPWRLRIADLLPHQLLVRVRIREVTLEAFQAISAGFDAVIRGVIEVAWRSLFAVGRAALIRASATAP